MKKNKDPKKGFFRKRRTKILLSILLLFLIVRLILPYVILHYANEKLSGIPGYFGHIKDIDLAVYRGAYVIKDFYLHKADTITQMETEFLDAKKIDLSLEWHALFDGRIVGELEFESPTLRFTKDKAEPAQVAKDTSDLRKLLRDFMPLKVNRFEVFNGTLQYVDEGSKPRVNIRMDNTHILAENLTNVKDTALLPSLVTATANVYGGTMNFNMKLDPLANDPTFDMNLELKETNLPELNDFFKAYAKIDVNKGVFGLYTEIAAKDRKFIGYVKPFLVDLDVLGPEDKNDPLLTKFWEGLVGGAGVIFRNQKHDQVATKVPLEGTFSKTRANIWYAILDILRNAFIEALKPNIDREIGIESVSEVGGPEKEKKKNLLEKIFQPKNKKETKEK